MDPLVTKFFNQLQPGDQTDPDPIGTSDLEAIRQQLATFDDSTQAEMLTDVQRKDLLGKRSLSLPTLMQYCAAGLQKVPELATELEIQAGSFDTISAQDLGLGGLIKMLEMLAQGGQDRHFQSASECDALNASAHDALNEAIQAPGLDPATLLVLKSTFEEPVRLEQHAQKAKKAVETLSEGKLEQTSQQLQATLARPEVQQLLENFINAAKAQAPATPAPAQTTHKTAAHKATTHKAPAEPTPPVVGVPVADNAGTKRRV